MSDQAQDDAAVMPAREQSHLSMLARRREAEPRQRLSTKAATAVLGYAEQAAERAMLALGDALEDMALAHVRELSKRYPTRTVKFCSAMGSTSLEISRRNDPTHMDGYLLEAPADPLMAAFERTCDAYGFGHLPIRYITAKGGQIVANLADW